jgi:glycosyltransferase involved in cell wall biosynthesis
MTVAPRVVFIALHAYGLFFPQRKGAMFGGSEVRAWRFARTLARRAVFDVSFIVMDQGQGELELDGVRVIPHPGYSVDARAPAGPTAETRRHLPAPIRAALRRLRYFGDPWRARRFPGREVYASAAADAYCVYGVSDLAADVIRFCRNAGRASLLFVGSDEELSPAYRPGSLGLNVYGSLCGLCHYAIVNADAVIVQSEAQKAMAASRFGREAHVVRNPIDLKEMPALHSRRYVAWIGKSDGVKRPDLFIEAARLLPHIEFRMILNRSDADMHARVRASAPANVTVILDQATIEESREFVRGAALLANTSRFEGFANAMLEACAAGVPLVALAVDPEGFIAASGSGEAAGGDFKRFVSSIASLMSEAERRAQLGRNARRYVESRHELEARAAELEAVLAGLVGVKK